MEGCVVMSKLYENYLLLKKQDNSKLYLFKSGIFYLFLDDDAKIVSPILNLRLTNLNEKVLKCGFPVNNLNKYINLITSNGYEVNIIDSNNKEVYKSNDYISNENIKNFIKSISKIDTNLLSISEAYEKLDHISSKANEILKEMN